MEIKITKTTTPGIMPPEDKLGFGKCFSDHMFIMDYDEGMGWHDARVVPYQNLSLDPACMVFHYAQEMFEGLKAYRTESGEIQMFRPMENIRRMNSSSERMCLPKIDEDDFLYNRVTLRAEVRLATAVVDLKGVVLLDAEES